MLKKEELQKAISIAASGLPAVAHTAFEQSAEGWKSRPECLTSYYSSGEAVVCSILLCFYFELYGRDCEVVRLPEDREFTNSVTDLVWPGGWYFYSAGGRLTNSASWDAIKAVLP